MNPPRVVASVKCWYAVFSLSFSSNYILVTYFLFHNGLFSSMLFNFQVCCYFLDIIIDLHFLPPLPRPKYPELFNLLTCIMICFMGQCLIHLERTRNDLWELKIFLLFRNCWMWYYLNIKVFDRVVWISVATAELLFSCSISYRVGNFKISKFNSRVIFFLQLHHVFLRL